MAKILLDYVFPISVLESIPQASTAFLRQVAVVAKPKAGQEGNVGQLFPCTSIAQVLERTNNSESEQLFNAGMNRVHILLANDLDLADALETYKNEFYTLLISSDFSDADIIDTPAVAATGTIEITDFSNLLADTPDEIEVAGVTFTAQSSAVNPGDATFQADDSNEATAQSLADQINAHSVASALVQATAVDETVELEAVTPGQAGNALTLVYTDKDSGGTSVGATVSGAGTLEGGADANPAIDLGTYEGVLGFASSSIPVLQAEVIKSKRCGFYKHSTTGAKNLFFAFGKLLSNQVNWLNQQFIEMPFDDQVTMLSQANAFFDDRISFVLSDDEFSTRLAMFVAGGKAIVAPYILKNLRINLQSRALQWINLNQPQYTIKEASLLETRLQEDVINDFIERGWIESGSISITLREQNFVASGEIEVPTPKALWRVFNQMTETT